MLRIIPAFFIGSNELTKILPSSRAEVRALLNKNQRIFVWIKKALDNPLIEIYRKINFDLPEIINSRSEE